MINEIVNNANKIIGQKCWNAYNPLFGWIRLNFGGTVYTGPPDEDNNLIGIGQYSIYVVCQWRLDDGNHCLCSKASSREKVIRTIVCLIGDSVTKIEIYPPVWDAVFTFASGKQLKLFCDFMDQEAWDHSWSFRVVDTEYRMGINNVICPYKNTDILPDVVLDPFVIDIPKQIESMCQVNSSEIIQGIADKIKTQRYNNPDNENEH